ncbi:IS66 family transposase [Aquimarina algiphila]|uniref:IS66 family transposase n=1 Tax=Aquimarina algiphila TaxID=2047982 RepID=UPI00232E8D2D|nr:IS66 family transposase [Aquimarina algiphila]
MLDFVAKLMGFRYLYYVGIIPDTPLLDQQSLLQESYDILVKEHQKLQFDYQYLQQQLSELKHLIFGSKSERYIPLENGQLDLFVAQSDVCSINNSESIEISYKREKQVQEKQQAVRQVLPSHLPRIEEIIEPDNILAGATKIGEEVTEILEYNPSTIFVRRIIRPKYILTEQENIVVAPLPSLPIPKGNAGAGLLAHIMVSKFVHHLPFYRQQQIFKSQDLAISRGTLCNWFNATTRLLEPLYDTLQKELLQSNYLQVDESPIGVQDTAKKGKLHMGYHWVHHAPIEGLVLFKYDPSRSRKVPEEILQDYNGTIQTDGYSGYINLTTKGSITLLACMAHARRYFEKALDNDASRASYVLEQIQRLYAMERKTRERESNFTLIKRYRELYAIPVLNRLEIWLKEQVLQVLPKSAIGKAIGYTLKLWDKLKRYTTNGCYMIDNNLVENTIRPLALGRKNYLFSGSHKAAQKGAILYSFFASCKINAIDPYIWLKDVLENIQEYKVNQLQELLPNNWRIS